MSRTWSKGGVRVTSAFPATVGHGCSDSQEREKAPLCPLPRTHRLPGLGQEAAILLLQALGQSLQILQLLIHSLGTLQSLLGTEWGRGRWATREVNRARRHRSTQGVGSNRDLGVGHRDPEGGGQRPNFYLKD